MPVMFVNGTNDFAYPMDSYARTCALVRGEKNYSIQLNMRHGHIFDFPEFFLFVDQFVNDGEPMPVVGRPTIDGPNVSARVASSTGITAARLLYTTGEHQDNKTRKWLAKPLEIGVAKVHGEAPPSETTVWYVEVRDNREAVITSELIVRK